MATLTKLADGTVTISGFSNGTLDVTNNGERIHGTLANGDPVDLHFEPGPPMLYRQVAPPHGRVIGFDTAGDGISMKDNTYGDITWSQP